MKKTLIVTIIASFLPMFAAADVKNLSELVTVLIAGVNSLVPLLFGLAIVAFIWNIIKYLYAADPKELATARNYIVFSIVAIAVMMSVWALSFMVKDLFFPDTTPLNIELTH